MAWTGLLGDGRGSHKPHLDDFDRSARLVVVPALASVSCGVPDEQKFVDLAVAHQCVLLSMVRVVMRMRMRLARLQVRAAARLEA